MEGTAARLAPLPLTAAERASLDALSHVVARIEHTVVAETEALRQHRVVDLAAVNQRKRQGLLELSRILPQVNAAVHTHGARDLLAGLSDKLARNREALDIQLRAVKEVADIVAAMIREGESDGTYTAAMVRR